MTGAMLRRIREAYDLTLAQVAEMSGLSTSVIGGIESRGVSYAHVCRLHCPKRNSYRQLTWRQYLKALRSLRTGHKSAVRTQAISVRHGVLKPSPDAVMVERDGVREWAKVVEYRDGRKYGFAWRNGDWYRAAWVEERFLGRVAKPRFRESDEAFPDAGLARWRNGY